MEMKKLLILTFLLAVLFAGKAYGQDKFVGTWVMKEIVADPDSVMKDRTSANPDMVIVKVTDEYYRSTVNDFSLLYKIKDDNTIYSDFSPERKVVINWKKKAVIEVTITIIENKEYRPATMVWTRKKEK
jgi:hypothetical protein